MAVGDTKLSVDDKWNPASDVISPIVDGEEYSLQIKSHSSTGAMQLQFRGTVVSRLGYPNWHAYTPCGRLEYIYQFNIQIYTLMCLQPVLEQSLPQLMLCSPIPCNKSCILISGQNIIEFDQRWAWVLLFVQDDMTVFEAGSMQSWKIWKGLWIWMTDFQAWVSHGNL